MLTRVCSLVFLIFGTVAALASPQDEASTQVLPKEKEPATTPDAVPAKQAEKPEGAPAPSKPAEGPKPPLQFPSAILGELSHEDFKHRLSAQDSLLKWGMKDLSGSIEMLYGVYRGADDPELRFRSRQVLKRLVIVQQPFDGDGYLGIQMEPAQWKNPRGQLQPVVRITVVREGTAAEVAKLKVNDLVTGVDQIVFDDLAPTRMFADYIQSKKPGDVIALHLRRGEEKLTLKASLRRRSPLLDELTRWGTQLILPDQSELDESDFQDWLKMRRAADRLQSRGEK
jgi:hypothetical protein